MYKNIAFILLVNLTLISCNGITQEIKPSNTVQKNFNIDGKYATDEGKLEIIISEDIVYFTLLVVDSEGRTGDVKGELIVKGNNSIYETQDCQLKFEFAEKEVTVAQDGTCEMGVNVVASGVYKSTASYDASLVIGQVGDSLEELFYSESESTYKKYCEAGMEENSGYIICKTRNKSGGDSSTVHIFSGSYEGPDGELPPLKIAKKYKISSTN